MSSSNGRIVGILVEVFGLPDEGITDDLTMKDVETWDSLRHMRMIVAVEESYGIQLEFDEIVSMQSVGAIKQVLSKRGLEC